MGTDSEMGAPEGLLSGFFIAGLLLGTCFTFSDFSSKIEPDVCECTNPFQGTRNHYRGDPEALCSDFGPGFCYVDCNRACRDEKPTASRGRCQSTLACGVYHGDLLERNNNKKKTQKGK